MYVYTCITTYDAHDETSDEHLLDLNNLTCLYSNIA